MHMTDDAHIKDQLPEVAQVCLSFSPKQTRVFRIQVNESNIVLRWTWIKDSLLKQTIINKFQNPSSGNKLLTSKLQINTIHQSEATADDNHWCSKEAIFLEKNKNGEFVIKLAINHK